MEGALAVVAPWLITKATLGTVWFGLTAAGLVLAAMLGTLLSPVLEHWMGNRRMVLLTASSVAASLAAAAFCWANSFAAAAYAFVLFAMAADSACDIGFASRMPLLAKFSGERLEQFSGANWLWGICGMALGSVVAGWALSANYVVEAVAGVALLSLITATGLAFLLPRESRKLKIHPKNPHSLLTIFNQNFWTPRAIKLAILLIVVVIFAGPVDNLLLPGHLAANNWPPNTFGDMLAAIGLGVAAGLFLTQRSDSTVLAIPNRRRLVVIGLIGFACQLGMMLWLPHPWILLSGLFLCAVLFAPLLPMMEASMLTAAPPAQRTLMLSALSTLLSIADVVGTIGMGAIISVTSSTIALAGCVAIAGIAAIVYGVWPNSSVNHSVN
jgi:predicted MFS family arabinose efflux permease